MSCVNCFTQFIIQDTKALREKETLPVSLNTYLQPQPEWLCFESCHTLEEVSKGIWFQDIHWFSIHQHVHVSLWTAPATGFKGIKNPKPWSGAA